MRAFDSSFYNPRLVLLRRITYYLRFKEAYDMYTKFHIGHLYDMYTVIPATDRKICFSSYIIVFVES